jgi:hypothetical protein
MKHWKMMIFDLCFIVGGVYFLSLPAPNSQLQNIQSIKKEFIDHNSLTPKLSEYLNKTEVIYRVNQTEKTKLLTELNQSYPDETTIIMNLLYNK